MSNPTTPFGWQMPTNTDLVTDLPADFEVFGQAVATDLQYLLGGTTGQVLAKASGTDLDFDWVTDATGMSNPMTTTGDIIYSSPGSTPVRLGIGTANQMLRVNSGATAPEWATVSASGMTLITTNNFSAVSAANLDNVFSATYLSYQVVVTFSTSANASPDLKLRNAGSNITSGNNYAYVAGPVGGASIAAATGGSAFVGLPNVAGGCEYYITFVITNVFTTKPTFAYGSHGFISGGSKGLYTGGISQDNLSTIDGFSVNVGSGTITGTASVYGLAI